MSRLSFKKVSSRKSYSDMSLILLQLINAVSQKGNKEFTTKLRQEVGGEGFVTAKPWFQFDAAFRKSCNWAQGDKSLL